MMILLVLIVDGCHQLATATDQKTEQEQKLLKQSCKRALTMEALF